MTLSFRFFIAGLNGCLLASTLSSHCMRIAPKFVQANIFFAHLSSSSTRFEKSKEQDSTCIDEVSAMITTFDYVATLIALLVSECPEGANVKAAQGSYG